MPVIAAFAVLPKPSVTIAVTLNSPSAKSCDGVTAQLPFASTVVNNVSVWPLISVIVTCT